MYFIDLQAILFTTTYITLILKALVVAAFYGLTLSALQEELSQKPL